ncbi:hypothetical protein B0H19DRAFT_1366605 [Mycena capillaripes]|nr:hypothetical protein B0H19DRAFT_1366605 [Mycena capillaripes]
MPMRTFRTTSITAENSKRNSNRVSLGSFASLVSLTSLDSGSSIDTPIVVTTTVSTTTVTYPGTVPPPFAPSLGSDERLPRPRHGAPPVAPAMSLEERQRKQQGGVTRSLRRAVGLERTRLDPALCEGWWYVYIWILILADANPMTRFRDL